MTARSDNQLESVRLSQLETDRELVAKAARQPDGVRVLDDTDGRYLFRLSIPSTPLPDDTSYDDAVLAIAREVIAMADSADNDPASNVVVTHRLPIVGRDEHALRVLFEGRLTDDVAEAVAALRSNKEAR